MKRLSMCVIIGLCLVGLSGCLATDLLTSVTPAGSLEEPRLSAQDHLNQAQMVEQDLGSLEEQVARINQKVARYDQKPYLDPKRFRRDGLKILRGSKLKEIEMLRETVAWHRAQASRLAGLDSASQEQTLEGGDSGSEQESVPGSRVPHGTPVGQTPHDSTTTSS